MSDELHLPDFYMPFPVGMNPHLDEVRESTMAWARQMGLFDAAHTASSQWSEESCRRADYPQFIAMAHPNLSKTWLETVTEWHVYMWYIDDLMHVWAAGTSRRETIASIERLLSFLPVEAETVIEGPQTPSERAVEDLWNRTAWTASPAWRCRMASAIRRLMYGQVWEAANLSQDGPIDPVEALDMRRKSGMHDFTIALLEHAGGLALPERFIHSLAYESVSYACVDATAIQNDFTSFARERAHGELRSNMIEVVRCFLGLSLEVAADLWNHVLTMRVQTMEYAINTSVPQFLDDVQAGDDLRRAVQKYVQILQDYVAGSYAWQCTSARFRTRS